MAVFVRGVWRLCCITLLQLGPCWRPL